MEDINPYQSPALPPTPPRKPIDWEWWKQAVFVCCMLPLLLTIILPVVPIFIGMCIHDLLYCDRIYWGDALAISGTVNVVWWIFCFLEHVVTGQPL